MRKLAAPVSIVSLALTALAVPAIAAESDEISAVLTEEVLSQMGVESISDELLASLEDSVETAVVGGVIEEDIVSAASAVIDEGDDGTDLATAVEANQEVQDELWEEDGEVLAEAFDDFSNEFNACRGAADACSDDFAERFRARWVDKENERISTLTEEIEQLDGAQREAAEQRLAARIERLETRQAQEPGRPAPKDALDSAEKNESDASRGSGNDSPGNSGKKGQSSPKSNGNASPKSEASSEDSGSSPDPDTSPESDSSSESSEESSGESNGKSEGKSQSKANDNSNKGNGKKNE